MRYHLDSLYTGSNKRRTKNKIQRLIVATGEHILKNKPIKIRLHLYKYSAASICALMVSYETTFLCKEMS